MSDIYKLFLIRADGSYSISNCKNISDCDDFQICKDGDCICIKNYEFINDNCEKCSNEGESPNTEVFITASQIALSAALLMGIAALIMVIYRLCTKPRYLSARAVAANNRAAAELGLDNGYSNYLRASLSSIQIRVLTRLRDRPPTYESREPNSVTMIESPPPYEDPGNLDTYLPPPYAEIVLSPTGYLNISFVDTETNSNTTEHNSNSTNHKNQETTVSETSNVQDTGQQNANNNDSTSSNNNQGDNNNCNNNNNNK